MVQTVIFC